LLILRALRGAEAPLFHGTIGIQEFFRKLLGHIPSDGRSSRSLTSFAEVHSIQDRLS
jgi:hypothetical protein